MFYLSDIEHKLRLPPEFLHLTIHDAVMRELEGLFIDKVIANLGLCISIYDIKFIDGGYIHEGDGAATYTVGFRLVMFRPVVGEVIAAKLKEFDANGLRLSLGFFDDIYVPVQEMPRPSHLEADEETKQIRWVWKFTNDEGDEIVLPIEGMEEIRFRVHSIKYPSIPVEEEKQSNLPPVEQGKQANPPPVEQGKESNPPPVKQEKQSNLILAEGEKQSKPLPIEKEKESKPFAPMVVIGSLVAADGPGHGLGPISWWI